MSSVYIANLSPSTTKESLDKFMVSRFPLARSARRMGGPGVPSLETSRTHGADLRSRWRVPVSQAFCGSIQSIEMQEAHKAIVVFEKPSAASTALMLNGRCPTTPLREYPHTQAVQCVASGSGHADETLLVSAHGQAARSTARPSRSRARS